MKSLTLSSIITAIPTPTPTHLNTINAYTTKLSCPSNHKANECSPSVPKQQRHCSKLSRREAIGLMGFFLAGVGAGGGGAMGIGGSFLQRAEAAAEPCQLTVAPSGLAFCDEVVGTGPVAVKGQLINAHYVGRLENGKVFDSSYNRGKPLTFRVGVGEGWDEGILGGEGVPPMQAGGKRTLKLPPELGYGMRGAGCRGGSCIIPPDSVLLFDVELLK